MTTTTMQRKSRSVPVFGLKALVDEGPGVFEAIVSVFENVDYINDRVKAGAFVGSLARWKASGDPIPTIFSHQWENLDSHIGEVLEAKELLPGDALLPPELASLGGLWTKFRLDVDEPEEVHARKVARLLASRRIKEFSFAYDVIDQQRGTDGANELTELDLIEVGPTLKGMNPLTRTLSASLDDDDRAELELLELVKEAPPAAAKAYVEVDFPGAIETELEAVHSAASTWARGNDIGTGGFYWLYLEATFPADGRAVVLVEGWDDACGDGVFYELSYTLDGDGVATVADPHEVEVEVTTTLKHRTLKHRRDVGSLRAAKATATVSGEGKSTGNPEDPATGNGEDLEASTDHAHDGGDPALVELELLEQNLTS